MLAKSRIDALANLGNNVPLPPAVAVTVKFLLLPEFVITQVTPRDVPLFESLSVVKLEALIGSENSIAKFIGRLFVVAP